MHRLSIPVDEDLFNALKFIPSGMRSEVCRSLLVMLMVAQQTNLGKYVVHELLQNELVIARIDDIVPGKRREYEQTVKGYTT